MPAIQKNASHTNGCIPYIKERQPCNLMLATRKDACRTKWCQPYKRMAAMHKGYLPYEKMPAMDTSHTKGMPTIRKDASHGYQPYKRDAYHTKGLLAVQKDACRAKGFQSYKRMPATRKDACRAILVPAIQKDTSYPCTHGCRPHERLTMQKGPAMQKITFFCMAGTSNVINGASHTRMPAIQPYKRMLAIQMDAYHTNRAGHKKGCLLYRRVPAIQ